MLRIAVIAFLLAATASTLQAADKIPTPSTAEQLATEKAIAELFAHELSSRKPSDRLTLAKKMLDTCFASKNDPAGQYGLAKAAMEMAIDVGSVDVALSASDFLADAFDGDGAAIRLDALSRLNARVRDKAGSLVIAWTAAQELRMCECEADFERAERFAAIAADGFRRSGEVELAKRAADRAGEFRSAQQLRREIDDNGRYTCFLANRWAEGLPMLLAGSEWQAIARREMTATTDLELIAAADDWWDASEAFSGVEWRSIRDHAGRLYVRSLASVEGLTRLRTEQRLASIEWKDAIRAAAITVNRELEGWSPPKHIWPHGFPMTAVKVSRGIKGPLTLTVSRSGMVVIAITDWPAGMDEMPKRGWELLGPTAWASGRVIYSRSCKPGDKFELDTKQKYGPNVLTFQLDKITW